MMSLRSLRAATRLFFVALLLVAAGPMYGQAIIADPGGASCDVGPKCEKHKYEFQSASGQTFLRWQVSGDLLLLSPADQNPAIICSAGYGKGRITAQYYTMRKDERCREKCPDTLFYAFHYDVFKRFDAPHPIHGPTCIAPGVEVTYWVPPILTDWSHRSAGIGTDGYRWTGFPAGTVVNISGDSSVLTLVIPAGTPAFTLECQVGRCNGAISLPIHVNPLQPVISGGPTCLPVVPLTSFPLTIQAEANTTYLWLLPTGWQIQPAGAATVGITSTSAGPLTVQVSPGRGSGDVVVVAAAAGGCGTSTSAPFHLSRRLVVGGTVLSDPGCLTAQQPVTLTLSNAPINESLTWTVPSGWLVASPAQPQSGMADTYLTTSATLTLTPTSNAGTVTVTTTACPTVSVVRPLAVTAAPSGCEFSITQDAGCASFYVTPGAGCPTTGNRYKEWRLYDTSVSATVPVAVQTNAPASASNTGIFAFYATPIAPTNLRVEVDVVNASCFAATYSATGNGQGLTFTPCPQRPAVSSAGGAPLRAYPNPAGSVLTVELPVGTRGVVKLTLTDVTGKIVQQRTTDQVNVSLDVSNLPSGSYLLAVQPLAGSSFVQRVVVRH